MKKTTTLILWLMLVLFAPIAMAQSILVLPKIAAEKNYCTELSTNTEVKALLMELNQQLKMKGHQLPNLPVVMRKMQAEGGCEGTQDEVIRNLALAANTDFYFIADAAPQDEQFGRQVFLTLEVFNRNNELVTVIEEYSGKFNTPNDAFLAGKALKLCYMRLRDEMKNGAAVIVANNTEKPKKECKSDVDVNIPKTGIVKPLTYALIIGNENYSKNQVGLNSESDVDYAMSDAQIFKEYVVNTLGVPESNVTLLLDAKALEMDGAIQKLNSLAKVNGGEAELIFYYAGHGFPDEITQEPYLIPVDVSATTLKYAMKLKDVFDRLTEFPSKRVTIFLDACFSGGARNQGLLAARAVKVKPKKSMLAGNVVVFSSSSDDQSSLPYHDKCHGLFTYYLLKNMQLFGNESSYSDLADYMARQVGNVSINVLGKEQNPKTNVSAEAIDIWEKWKFSDIQGNK